MEDNGEPQNNQIPIPISNPHNTFLTLLSSKIIIAFSSFVLGILTCIVIYSAVTKNSSPKKNLQSSVSLNISSPTPTGQTINKSVDSFFNNSDRYFEEGSSTLQNVISICGEQLWEPASAEVLEVQCIQFSGNQISKTVNGKIITYSDSYSDLDAEISTKLMSDIHSYYDEIANTRFKQYLVNKTQIVPVSGGLPPYISIYAHSKEVTSQHSQDLVTTYSLMTHDTSSEKLRLDEIFDALKAYSYLADKNKM